MSSFLGLLVERFRELRLQQPAIEYNSAGPKVREQLGRGCSEGVGGQMKSRDERRRKDGGGRGGAQGWE